jgi:hypothetical protein
MSEPGAGSSGIGGLVASLESAGVPVEQLRAGIGGLIDERPEVAVVGAFAGGLIVAMIVRRLGS